MNKETFMSAAIMLGYKTINETSKYPAILRKDRVELHVYNKNLIVRLGTNTKNHHLTLDIPALDNFLFMKKEKDYQGKSDPNAFFSNGPKTGTTRFKTKIS